MSINDIFIIYLFHIFLLIISFIFLILVIIKYFRNTQSFYAHILFNIIIISFFHPLGYSLYWKKEEDKNLNDSLCDIQGFIIIFSECGIDLWMINLLNTLYLMIFKNQNLSLQTNKLLLYLYYFTGYIIPLIISCIFLIKKVYNMSKLNYCLIKIKDKDKIFYIFYFVHVLPILYCIFFFYQMILFYNKMKKFLKSIDFLNFFFSLIKLAIFPFFLLLGCILFSITNFQNKDKSILIILAGLTYSLCCIFFSFLFFFDLLIYNCCKKKSNEILFDSSLSQDSINELKYFNN